MRITDLYLISILHRYNHLPSVGFPSVRRPRSESCLPCARLGWWATLTIPKIYRSSLSSSPTTPPNPEPLSPDDGWGHNMKNLPSVDVEQPPAGSKPNTLLSRSKKALSKLTGTSNWYKYAKPAQPPAQPPARIPGVAKQNKRPPSTASSSDDEVSSDSSSSGSLSTPPAHPRRLLTPIYGPVGLPPGTGRAVVTPTDDDLEESACRRLISRAFSPQELPSLIEGIFTKKDEVKMIGSLDRVAAQSFIDVVHEVRHAALHLRGAA